MIRNSILFAMLFICKLSLSQSSVPFVNLSNKDETWQKEMAVFVEDFNDNRNSWFGTQPRVNFNIQDGKILVTEAPNPYYGVCSSRPITEIDFADDFLVSVEFSISTNPDARIGLFCIFGVDFSYCSNETSSAMGLIILYKGKGNVWKGMKITNGTPTTITIVKKNDVFSVYFNEMLLKTYDCTKEDFTNTIHIYADNPNRTTTVDFIKVYLNYNSVEEHNAHIELRDFNSAKLTNEFDLFLEKHPDSKYENEIIQLKEEYFYRLAISGFIKECETYLSLYPSGKYITEATKLKDERTMYNKALYGNLPEHNAYLTKYPNGTYSSEVLALKTKKIQEIERNKKITVNSNKNLWRIGNKMCMETSLGTICGTLNAWNEDNSMMQIKVISGPDTRLEGQQIQANEIIWVNADKQWHICLQDEIDASVEMNDKYKYWKLGKIVYLSGTKGNWIFRTNVTIKGEIIQWNEDKSKVRIRIIDGADGALYNGEYLYNDKMIWDDPSGWKLN